MRLRIALGVMASFFVCALANAAENHQFWVGEKHEESGQPWYPCETNSQTAAQNICTVYLPGSGTQPFNYTVDVGTSNGGNRCGYTQFKVACYDMPQIANNRQKTIKIGELNSDAGCGADPVQIARQFCAIQGPNPTSFPFTLTRTSTRGGNQCGYNTYEIKCREPFPALGLGPSVR